MLSSHHCNKSSKSAAASASSSKVSLIVQGEMDTLGKSILKGREWNFLLEVSGSTDGLDRELQSIPGVDEVENAAARMVSSLHR